MNKTFSALFVLIVLIISGCGSDSTNSSTETIPKSKDMSNFIMPLGIGNFWEFIEYRQFYKENKSIGYDTVTYKLSIKSMYNWHWEEYNKKMETYDLISDKIEYGMYDKPAIFGTGNPGIQFVLGKVDDTLKISQAAYFDVLLGNSFYPTEKATDLSPDKWTPAGIKLKQTYNNVTYDTVYVWRIPDNPEFTSEYHFVKGIGLVYWEEFYKPGGFKNIIGNLKSYKVK